MVIGAYKYMRFMREESTHFAILNSRILANSSVAYNYRAWKNGRIEDSKIDKSSLLIVHHKGVQLIGSKDRIGKTEKV